MRKILFSFFLVLLSLSLSGCDLLSSSSNTGTNDKTNETDNDLIEAPNISSGTLYEDAEKKIKNAGFTNISFSKIEDLITGWLTKDGEVDYVTYDGEKPTSSTKKFSKDAKVIIYYHTFPSNGEDDPNRIKAPKIERGTLYEEAEKIIKEAGFTNIKFEKKKDLISAWLYKDGEVDAVTYNGEDYTYGGKSFDKDIEVIIRYHTFSTLESIPTIYSWETYAEVEKKFKDAGFENVETEPIEDYKYYSQKDGTIEKITYNGEIKDAYTTLRDKEDKITIYYHTFPESIKNYVSPNKYTYLDTTEDYAYEQKCDSIYEGYTLHYSVSNEKSSVESTNVDYYFNFKLNIATIVSQHTGYRSSNTTITSYDIVGDIENGWKILKDGKLSFYYQIDNENNKLLAYYEGNENPFKYDYVYHENLNNSIGMILKIDCNVTGGYDHFKIYKYYLCPQQ